MQRQPELAAGIVGPDGPVAERRVADRQVEALGQPRLGEVLGADPGVREQALGDAGGDRVRLDAGQAGLARQGFRKQGQEQAGAAAGLQDGAAGEAHAGQRLPDRPHDEFGSEMSILRGSREAGELGRRHQPFQFGAHLLPAGAERLAGAAEQGVGEFGRAEAGEAGQQRLFLGRRRPVRRLDLAQQPDGGQVVGGTALPRRGECTVPDQAVVAGGWLPGRGRQDGGVDHRRRNLLPQGAWSAERGAQGGAVEQRELQQAGAGFGHGKPRAQRPAPGCRGQPGDRGRVDEGRTGARRPAQDQRSFRIGADGLVAAAISV